MLVMPLPSMARHYAVLPPFRVAKGRAGEGLAFAGNAPAEHGSALRCAPSLSRSEGEGWGGVCFSLVKPLPSMARHYGLGFRAGVWVTLS